jgi:hypothetical protein
VSPRIPIRSLITSTVVLGALSAPGPAAAAVDLRTPKGAAYCDLTRVSARLSLVCWTPYDGFTATMRVRGRATTRYVGDREGHTPRVRRVLRYGQTWRSRGFRCTSRRSGVTCRNRDRHGWWLGRRFGYRLY